MNLKDTYNKIARDWHEDHLKDDWWIDGTDQFISLFTPGSTILDIGCAGGTKAKYFIEHGLKVMGIDFSEEMINISREFVPEARFQILDLTEVSSLTEMYDGIFIQAVLLHIPKSEVQEQIKQIVTKLKDEGYLYIAVKETKPNTPEEKIKTESDYGYEYERFFSYFNMEEIRGYLSESELTLVSETITPSGKTNWIQVVAQK
ncbi:class I SAM-dependent methyltransferase [Candidatus Nomurabacteria bacterium]|nr:class I SAM-dependent methyltransferase [Candidatus Nomurabacteria bacterium]